MDRSKAHIPMKRRNKNSRCVYSYKLTENKEVVLEKCAVEYVKKQGYLVIPMPSLRTLNLLILLSIFTSLLLGASI